MNTLSPVPGLYPDMLEALYRPADGLNQSFIKQGRNSWAKAVYQRDHPSEPTSAKILGNRCHEAILEPERIKTLLPIKPAGMSFATKEGKEWRSTIGAGGWITQDDHDTIKGVTESVNSHREAALVLNTIGLRECPAFANDPETGLLLKGKFDLLPDRANFLVDVKTTEDASLHAWQRDCATLGYHIQAALYCDLANLCGRDVTEFFFVVVEKSPPYVCQVYQMNQKSITRGRDEYKKLLVEYQGCLLSGKYPGYFDGIKTFDLPGWYLNGKEDEEPVYTLDEGSL